MIEPVSIVSDNLSVAWAKALEHALLRGSSSAPLSIIMGTPGGVIAEDAGIRARLDAALADRGLSSVDTVANTIFPQSLWNSAKSRQHLYDRYEAIWPHVRKCRLNANGVYFQRLIAYPEFSDDRKNQLEHVLVTYTEKGNHRHSAHQAAILYPPKDSTNQQQRGFPCLQQVAFDIPRNDGITVIGFYPKQHMFDKAYGNYLGLCRLGLFMAHELGKELKGLHCFVSHPAHGGKGIGKVELRELLATIAPPAEQPEPMDA